MASRRSLAKAYVQLMDRYPHAQLAAAMAPIVRENKADVALLAKDIASEVLRTKHVLMGTLLVAHQPSHSAVADIEAKLRQVIDAQSIQMDVQIDDRLIGGFVADTPAGTVDASVITMLDKLEVA